MTMYAAQCRVEVLCRKIYFHADGFMNPGWTLLAGNWVRGNDLLGQDCGADPVGNVTSPIFPAVVSAGDKYLIARVYDNPDSGPWTVNLWNTGTTGWDAILGGTSTGTFSVIIPAGTYTQILLQRWTDVTMHWDYVAISDYDVQVLDAPHVEVFRRDEREAISEASVEFLLRDIEVECRDHVKIWLAGGQTAILKKQFTGKIVEVQRLRRTILRRRLLRCYSYMIEAMDHEIDVSWKKYPEPASSAIASVVEELVTDGLMTTRSLVVQSSEIDLDEQGVTIFEALQDIVNDPRVNCSMFIDFDADLNIFKRGSRKAADSILESAIIDYRRVDDGFPGSIQNSVTVYGNWDAVWPTEQDGLSFCESFTKSDLVEKSIYTVWYIEGMGGVGDYYIQPFQGGLIGTSYVMTVYSSANPANTTDYVRAGRTFYPWMDGTKFSQMLTYWKSTEVVDSIIVRAMSTWTDYFEACFKPDWGNAFAANAWGGEPYVNTDITMFPFGDQAMDVQGSEIWKRTGSPNWKHIMAVEFDFHMDAPQDNVSVILDGMYFSGFCWVGGYKDATSIDLYGVCERSYEGNYGSNELCASVAISIVEAHKDPLVRIQDCLLKPRVNLNPAEEIRFIDDELNARVVINEVQLRYDNATLTTTIQLGDIIPGYITYERLARQAEKLGKTIDYLENRRIKMMFGRYSKYLPE